MKNKTIKRMFLTSSEVLLFRTSEYLQKKRCSIFFDGCFDEWTGFLTRVIFQTSIWKRLDEAVSCQYRYRSKLKAC